MLVSPEPNARAALELLLSAEGYETAGAANGEEALEMIERYAPGVRIVTRKFCAAQR